jgi:exodeoxyribonuclease-3
VNSLKARLPRVEQWLAENGPEIICLQETKMKDQAFPAEVFSAMGYETAHHGQGQWNGVAILSKVGLEDVVAGWDDDGPEDGDARILWATCGGVRVASVYVPNGRALDDPHYTYKLEWLEALAATTAELVYHQPELPIALMGDFNIAPLDTDVWNIDDFAGATHVSAAERQAFEAFEQIGLQDVVRPRIPTGYTYWDYQQLRFPKNEGMRIDFILGNEAFAERVTDVSIDRDERKGEGPSDHVPVVAEIN